MVASYKGHYECVRELIMQGADINYQREVCWVKNSFSIEADFCGLYQHHELIRLLDLRESLHEHTHNRKYLDFDSFLSSIACLFQTDISILYHM